MTCDSLNVNEVKLTEKPSSLTNTLHGQNIGANSPDVECPGWLTQTQHSKVKYFYEMQHANKLFISISFLSDTTTVEKI